jgi:ABC-type transporter Mla MlaB component
MSTITPTTAPGASAPVTHDLTLDGPLDAAATLALRGPVTQVVQDGPVLILVNVTGVTKVTASGVAGVLELRRLARSRGADVRLYGVSHAVVQAQMASELTAITRVYSSREAAVRGGRGVPPTATSGRPDRRGARERAQLAAHVLRDRLRSIVRSGQALMRARTRNVPTAAGPETTSKGMNR